MADNAGAEAIIQPENTRLSCRLSVMVNSA